MLETAEILPPSVHFGSLLSRRLPHASTSPLLVAEAVLLSLRVLSLDFLQNLLILIHRLPIDLIDLVGSATQKTLYLEYKSPLEIAKEGLSRY